MALFTILRTKGAINSQPFERLLQKNFSGGDLLKVSDGVWLVSAEGTARDVSALIGIMQGSPYSGTLVLRFDSFFGLQRKEVWDWIKAKSKTGKDS